MKGIWDEYKRTKAEVKSMMREAKRRTNEE